MNLFYCHCSVLWVGRAMPVWHIAAFLWMFSQPAFKAHKTPGFSRMTAFILLPCRKKNPPTPFLEETEANHWIHALWTATPNSTTRIHGTRRVPVPTHRHPSPHPDPKASLASLYYYAPANLLTPLSSRTFNKQQQSHKSAFYGMAEA